MFGGHPIELTDLGEELHRTWQTRGTISMDLISPEHVKVVFEQECEYKFVFWVQIWGLPRARINTDNVTKIGAEIGKVKGTNLLCPLEFKKPVARVRVDMDIKERLTKDLTIKLETGAMFHVTFNGGSYHRRGAAQGTRGQDGPDKEADRNTMDMNMGLDDMDQREEAQLVQTGEALLSTESIKSNTTRESKTATQPPPHPRSILELQENPVPSPVDDRSHTLETQSGIQCKQRLPFQAS
ncbi:hypothetical protein IFM89_012005 [Coptis chinensis]|uniref:DUF4283 domain-containing protein n=1 Tax=Coptis chinensis TaxID=261450 RepID=A0A835IZV5_9MAGN|nr:hypothetical protein IFM89_012005 [Coptis chinensis]